MNGTLLLLKINYSSHYISFFHGETVKQMLSLDVTVNLLSSALICILSLK